MMIESGNESNFTEGFKTSRRKEVYVGSNVEERLVCFQVDLLLKPELLHPVFHKELK